MHPRTAPFLLVALFGVLLFAAGCVDQAQGAGDCLEPREGVLVAVPCLVPGEPEPTPTLPEFSDGIGGGTPLPPSTGGLQLFLREGTCFTCHAIQGVPQAVGQIGPDLSQIGLQGEEYIRLSITDPNSVMVETCPTGPCEPDVMPQNFEETLTPEQIDALVEYLLTLQ